MVGRSRRLDQRACQSLTAIGGVPKAVVCDNLKAGVTKPSRYEPGINRSYQELATHYGFAVLPTRIKKPRDKAKAEVAVQIVQRFVLARLRNRRFELNASIRECVTESQRRIMRKLGKSRRELLETIERSGRHTNRSVIGTPSGENATTPAVRMPFAALRVGTA